MVTPVERTQQRIRKIENTIDRVQRQTTLGESGAAMKRAQLLKLGALLTAQRRKLARLEQHHA